MGIKDKKGKFAKKIPVFICISFIVLVIVLLKVRSPKQITILYSTDISMDGDFDDYFDLVAIQSLDDIDLKIIVDGKDRLQKQSGIKAINNLSVVLNNKNRYSEVIFGRDNNLESIYDADVDNDLIKILERTKDKIDIVTVGSLRDIAALYNSSPQLFESKVKRIWVFAGDAEGTMIEYNVALDESAFLRIMNSGKCDIYWIPCFQNGIWTTGINASYFTVKHDEVLHDADYRLQKWFLYKFEKSEEDFQEYISKNRDITEFMNETRNIWCAPLFPLINGSMNDYLDAYNYEFNYNMEMPCGFSERKVLFSEGGKVEYGRGNVIHIFEIYDYDEYVDFMRYVLNNIFSNMST